MNPQTETAQHTPGPWRVMRHSNQLGTRTLFVVSVPRGNVPVVYMDTAKSAPSAIDAEANARLIAAAPDLLAACKFAVKVMERDLESLQAVVDGRHAGGWGAANEIVRDYLKSPNGNPIEIARAAIARAEGRQP